MTLDVMGFLGWFGRTEALAADALTDAPMSRFAIGTDQIDPALMGFTSWTGDPISPVGRISRAAARQVPAVKRARDIICGTLGTIPLQVVDSENVPTISALLDQPETNVARSVTLTRLYEDLLYDGVAWWKVRATNYRGYPTSVERIDPTLVEVRDDGRTYVNGRVTTGTVLQFLSPNGGLLTDGARAIRTLLRLEASAANYADDPMPQGYFRPADDADPADDDDIRAVLGGWKTSRQQGATGYVPAALKYETVQWSPEQLQMTEARQHAVLEIARLTGIDAEDLSVSTTSRTYFNGQDRRLERISDVLGPYATAVTDRLRMRDVTPLGYEVRANFSAFLRADDKTRLENYTQAKALGLLTLDDIAKAEGLPAPLHEPATVTVSQLPQPTPREIEA